jgi:hypothetical protein
MSSSSTTLSSGGDRSNPVAFDDNIINDSSHQEPHVLGNNRQVRQQNSPETPTPAQVQSKRGRGSGPVDLDESIVDDETTTPGDVSCQNHHHHIHAVDLDSLQDREEKFEMIWKEHEDEFLVWKENEKLHIAALKQALKSSSSFRHLKKHGQSCRRGINPSARSSMVTNDKFQVGKNMNEPYQELDEDRSNSAGSIDTYGFSCISVDSYGFSIKSKKRQDSSIDAKEEDSRFDLSPEAEATRFASSEASRARTIRRIKEVLKKDSDDSRSVEPIASKARGLRTLRLRSANYQKRAYRVEPVFSTVHEHEEFACVPLPEQSLKGLEEEKISEKETHKVIQKPRVTSQEVKKVYPFFDDVENCNLVVQIQNDPTDGTLSVVSDITNLSDKLFLQMKQNEESKWDDVSSVGLSGVEGRLEAVKSISLGTDNMIYVEEVEGRNTEIPPVYYDASIKTPPFLLKPTSSEKMENPNDTDPESKWDDVSSIGFVGVEGLRSARNNSPKECDNGHVPSVITSHYVEDRKNKGSSSEKVGGSQDIFRKPQGETTKSKTADVELNPTFSTVWAGESDTSSSSGNFVDPEIQLEKEVSNASVSSEDSKESSTTCILTTSDWIILAAVFFVLVAAIIIVVVYVFTNL